MASVGRAVQACLVSVSLLTICGLEELASHSTRGVTHILSILDPDWPEPDAFRAYDTDSGRRTRLGFLCGREAGRLVRHESRRQAMARVAGHLSVEDLEAGFRSARDPTAARHF